MSKSDRSKSIAEQRAIDAIISRNKLFTTANLIDGIKKGDRSLLSQAITLVESTLEEDQQQAADVLKACLSNDSSSLRIGISGIPGVGKSTFIEALGTYLTAIGKRVAVLAIDPSSPLSKGSIMGDKTRMNKLSVNENAFVRPSASASNLGGVARKTRESIILCEAAGYDVILVETVGVGQSETAVYDMTDTFLLLLIAGAGDQLQGIKRGIMEMCDILVINKADGANEKTAYKAKSEFASALHFFPEKESGWHPVVETCSAIESKNIDSIWNQILAHHNWTSERGWFRENRKNQEIRRMKESIHSRITELIESDSELKKEIHLAEKAVAEMTMSSYHAAESIIEKFREKFNFGQ